MNLFGWFRRQPAAPDPDPPHVRGLYEYHDGRGPAVIDPVRADALLRLHGGEHWDDVIEVLRAAETAPASEKMARVVGDRLDRAVRDLADLACKVFDLQPVNKAGEGVTVAEALGVFAGYLAFVNDLRARWAGFPNSPARRASSPRDPDTGDWSPPTSPSPASSGGGPRP